MTNELIVLPSYYSDRIVACGRPSGLIRLSRIPERRCRRSTGTPRARAPAACAAVPTGCVSTTSLTRVPTLGVSGIAPTRATRPRRRRLAEVGGATARTLQVRRRGMDRPQPRRPGAGDHRYARLDDGELNWQAWVLSEPSDSARLVRIAVVHEELRCSLRCSATGRSKTSPRRTWSSSVPGHRQRSRRRALRLWRRAPHNRRP